MFCQRCGAKLPENTTKCPNCGAEYVAESATDPETNEKTPKKISFFTKKKIIITLLIVAILIFGGITAAVTLSNGSSISVSTSDMLQLADRYLKEMNYEQAIIEFQKILEIEPKNVDAYIGLAEAYVALEDNDRAIEVLERAQRNVDNDQRIENKLAEVNRIYESEPETVEPSTESVNTTATHTTSEPITDDAAAQTTTEPVIIITVPETTEQTTTAVVETTASTTPAPQTTAQPVTTVAETIDDNTIVLNDTNTYFTVQKGDVLKFAVDTSERVEWLSLNPYVAQIDQNGTVTVTHRGTAWIEAKYGGKTITFTIDSLSENLREEIHDAVINARFGTVNDIIVYLSDFAAGSGEFIERSDYDEYRKVASYVHTTDDYSAPVFLYKYVYIENNNIDEKGRIMIDGSTYNGLTFYNCETAFYEAAYYEEAIKRFDTIGKTTLECELLYRAEADPYHSGDCFYLSMDTSVYLSELPCIASYGNYGDINIVDLNISDSLKNELKKRLNSNDSLGICKVTIENYSCGYYPLGYSEYADFVEVQLLDGSIYKDNPQSVIIGDEEYRTDLTELDLKNKDIIRNFRNLRFMKKVKVLNLDGTGIYDLRCLVGLTNLEELYIRNNEMISESEIEMLKKILPNCKIYS